MEYNGKLYGKVDKSYFPLEATTKDFECLEKSIEEYKHKLQIAEKALNDILVWQEDVDNDWEYPETIASKALEQLGTSAPTLVGGWVAFDWSKIETRPAKYGKYLVCRKDGKIHWETWNGSGWAYNHDEIRFWAVITPPYG